MSDTNGPSDFNREIIAEFRANGGKVGGPFEGATLLLLHTTGAKSGAPRVNPMVCTILEEGIAVYASAAGAPTSPAWFHNLVANPDVEVELGTETFGAVAKVTTGTERNRLWEQQKSRMPGFAEYEAKTSREIPVVLLTRTS